MGRRLGDPADPLLVSVRSGAKFSMPGMMETVLNIGLNDESVAGLAAQSDDERFATDSYRRLLQMFGSTVLGVDGELFDAALDGRKTAKGTTADLDLDVDDLRGLVETLQGDHRGRDRRASSPRTPREQLDLAVRAVFDSWNADRAVLYRRQERIPEDLGTAVNVQAMVFGNQGMTSGSGRRLHPRPGQRRAGRLRRLPAERPGRGRRRRHPQHGVRSHDLAELDKSSYDELLGIMDEAREALPRHVRHRVHHRARQAVDAADPGRQAHRRGGVPDRLPHGRRGPDRPGRGAVPGHRDASSRS